jgi:NDP-sugar pyrophosphorylase family protein
MPKPLVRVGGRTLIERVLPSSAEAGASEVAVIINEDSRAVRDHVDARQWPFELRWIVETTASSMHSFLRVVETLAAMAVGSDRGQTRVGPGSDTGQKVRSAEGDDELFLISTVDTVAPPGAFASFMTEAQRHPDATVTLALTTPHDDETPLLVRLAGSTVVAIGDAAAPARYATAGYYAVRASILREAEDARRDGLTALRVFLERLRARGYQIDGIPSPDSIDVDRLLDVKTAEDFLRQGDV